MSERKPDIGRMIQEELDKGKPEARGAQPLEVNEKGEIVEAASELDQDIEAAFENITESKDTDAATKQAELGGDYARKVQMAFEKGDTKALAGIVEDFKAKGGDASVLREQLAGYHDAYQEAGLKEKAAEIDAFSRSLEARTDVATEGGKAFIAKLEAGEFDSLESAINALDGLKDQSKGMDKEALAELNNEFNTLFAAAQEKFSAQEKGQRSESGFDFGDDDMDDALSALG